MGNKADELACLNLAIRECSKQHGISKKIGLLLAGKDIERESNERPDFLRCYHSKEEGDMIIGIEHFRVDHHSEGTKNNKVISTGIQYEKNLNNYFNAWSPHINELLETPEGVLEGLGELISQVSKQHLQATYSAFIEALDYSLGNHIKQINYYHSVITKYTKNAQKKLIFLIEVHSDFSKLFFHDKNGTHRNNNTLPFFEDFVKKLEFIGTHKVDYLVFCFGNIIYDNSTRVVAVPARNLRKQIIKQNIPIYHYAGQDVYLNNFESLKSDIKVDFNYRKNGTKNDFIFQINSKEVPIKQRLLLIIDACKFIEQIKQKGQNYATTRQVEHIYELYNEYFSILFGASEDNVLELFSLINQNNADTLDLKYKAFKAKWG